VMDATAIIDLSDRLHEQKQAALWETLLNLPESFHQELLFSGREFEGMSPQPTPSQLTSLKYLRDELILALFNRTSSDEQAELRRRMIYILNTQSSEVK